MPKQNPDKYETTWGDVVEALIQSPTKPLQTAIKGANLNGEDKVLWDALLVLNELHHEEAAEAAKGGGPE